MSVRPPAHPTQFYSPLRDHHAHHAFTLPPATAHPPPPMLGGGPLVCPSRRTPPTPALGGRRSPPLTHPRVQRRSARSRRRTLVTATGAPALGRGALTLGHRRPVLLCRQPSRSSLPLGRHRCSGVRSPPLPLADLLLLEKNCDCVRRFRNIKFCFVQNHS
jgi:hypothetical protein